MSQDYASSLSEYENKGVCGISEVHDPPYLFEQKVTVLTDLLRNSSYTVVHTGAGLSTAAGIPDFRGPNGTFNLPFTILLFRGLDAREARQEAICQQVLRWSQTYGGPHGVGCVRTSRIYPLSHHSKHRWSAPSFRISSKPSLNPPRWCFHREVWIVWSKLCAFHECCSHLRTQGNRVEMHQTEDTDQGLWVSWVVDFDTLVSRGRLRDTVLDWEDELTEPDYANAVKESR